MISIQDSIQEPPIDPPENHYTEDEEEGEDIMFVDMLYDMQENKFVHTTDMTPAGMQEAVGLYLELQDPKDYNDKLVEKREEYHIIVTIDNRNDEYTCMHNCGDVGLRDRILLQFLMTLDE